MNKRSKFSGKILLLTIIILILFVRFSHYPQILGFDYDQEINAGIAKTIVVDHKPTLIGPETSTGGMYVGPFYNYIIALFFWLGKMNPDSTAALNIIIVTLTSILIYTSAKEIHSKIAGFLAMLLYGFSYLLAQYDWVSWNPTPIPLVSLGIFYFLWKFLKTEKATPLLIATFLTGFMVHLHFTALFLIGFYFLTLIFFKWKYFLKNKKLLVMIFSIFLFFLSPLIIFELRHSFLNTTHLLNFLVSGNKPAQSNSVVDALATPFKYIASLFVPRQSAFVEFAVFLSIILIAIKALRDLVRKLPSSWALFFILFLLPTVFLPFYHGPILPYYLSFLYTPALLITAVSAAKLSTGSPLTKSLVFLVFWLFLTINAPLVWTYRPPINLNHKKAAVDYIITDANKSTFKVDFVTERGMNTGFNYLFWFRNRQLVTNRDVPSEKKYKILIPYDHFDHSPKIAKFGAIGVEKINAEK